MIAKHIQKHQNTYDNYSRLAKYIASSPEEGEKLEDLWIVNSCAGDDLDMAILDIENTQKLSTRGTKCKTYHVLISFRDEQPNLKALKDIERQMAKTLGFEEHQRIVGTHSNTDNFHMHIAYNRVHPENYKLHMPYKAYRKMSDVCRRMEKKYNLKVDNGYKKIEEFDYEKPNQNAKNYEAVTWQQSVKSYAREYRQEILSAAIKGKSWQDLHDKLAEYDLIIKPKGNGLVIKPKNNKFMIKASDFDRSFSKNALTSRLGKFEENKSKKDIKIKDRYWQKPLTKHKNTKELWEKYQGLLKTDFKRNSKFGMAMRCWRDFIYHEAATNPQALMIIISQRYFLNAIFGTGNKKGNYMPKVSYKMVKKLFNDELKGNEKKHQDKLTRIIAKGIKTKADEKIILEEQRRLIETIDYQKERYEKGEWLVHNHMRIDKALKDYDAIKDKSHMKPRKRTIAEDEKGKKKARNKDIYLALALGIRSDYEKELLLEERQKVERGEFFYSNMKNQLITNENKLELLDKVLGKDEKRERTKFRDPKKLKAFLSKEERAYRKELLEQIFKNGIKSESDEKFLKEEIEHLTDSIKYFEENQMQGTWAKKNKTKIQKMLKEHKEKTEMKR